MTFRAKTLPLFIATGLALSGAVSAQSVLKNHDTYQPIDITAERLEMKQKEGRAIFKGAVSVKQGDMTLNADALTVFYQTENGVENPSISRLDAEGAVKLASDSETLTGDWGVYDVDRRLITLGGNVTFKQGDNTLKGDRLEFDLVSGLAKLDGKASEDGRVRGQFSVPGQKEKKDDQE
ncbi:lipopolysaccharide transport periplasmic protein LptA [Kordiimonas gwangyangensis]|uniref:lipopolysaccharide transport periplasmic protein LptA n=1 Tax=Kordiimonas gwangyangensis TaxID=288022 RepID=UPI00035CACBB|nr:lipopolysaccharide transport periplasmic protein LptA [Kordiimonas gwangyangensis]